MIGFQAAASVLGTAVSPPLIGLAIGVAASAFGLASVPLCLTAALPHITMQLAPTPLAPTCRIHYARVLLLSGQWR